MRCDFPVPGGPCTKVTLESLRHFLRAIFWSSFSPMLSLTYRYSCS